MLNIKNHFFDSIKNLIGVIVYYFCQWLMLIIVIRIAGFSVSGEFSLVISFTNVFGFVSMFGLQAYQLSDVEHRFLPQQYTGSYIITSGIAIVCLILALPFSGYNINVILCCLIYMIYKLCETFSLYCITYMQLENKYSNVTFSFCLKSIIPLAGFTVCLFFTHELLQSLLIMPPLFLAIIIIYDLKKIKGVFPHGIMFKETNHILKQCLPMMLSTLIRPIMLFLSRYTVGYIYGNTELGYFSAFTMVIVVLSTMAGAVYVVLLPTISKYYYEQQKEQIVRIIIIIVAIVFAVTLMGIFVAALIGDLIFSIIFGIDILPYMYLLIPVIFTGSMLTIMTFFTTCLTAMHKRLSMLISMMIGVLSLGILAVPATRTYGMLGTVNVFTLSLGIVIVIQCIVITYCIRKIKY